MVLRSQDSLCSVASECVHMYMCVSVEIGSVCAEGFKVACVCG